MTMRANGPDQAYEVVWPLGATEDDRVVLSPRGSDLGGRRIGLLWDSLFRGDEMFEVIKADLGEQYGDVTFVDHEVFGNLHGHDEDEVFGRLPEVFRSTEVDSVIVAVGA